MIQFKLLQSFIKYRNILPLLVLYSCVKLIQDHYFAKSKHTQYELKASISWREKRKTLCSLPLLKRKTQRNNKTMRTFWIRFMLVRLFSTRISTRISNRRVLGTINTNTRNFISKIITFFQSCNLCCHAVMKNGKMENTDATKFYILNSFCFFYRL